MEEDPDSKRFVGIERGLSLENIKMQFETFFMQWSFLFSIASCALFVKTCFPYAKMIRFESSMSIIITF